MRCSLVSSVFRTLHASCLAGLGIRSKAKPETEPLWAHRHARRIALTTVLVCTAVTGTSFSIGAPQALAEGPALYSSVALNHPALPPILASDEHTMLWSANGRLRNQAIEAMNLLASASDHGLPVSRYGLNTLTALSSALHEATAEVRFNELLTAATETYAVDLLQGLQPSAFKDRRDPKHVTVGRETMQSQLQAAVLKGLHRSIATNRVGTFIKSIEPNHPDYQKLQAALATYRSIAARGGWPEVPRSKSGKMLLPGDIHPRVAVLRERLKFTNDIPNKNAQQGVMDSVALVPVKLETAVADATTDNTQPNSEHVYDEALQAAVSAFQARHGLKADGKVGKNTRRALNVSADDRVRQLELNLDRWRLMPKVMPANHIWVNVPEYQLRLQLEREQVLDMRVVVGKRKWPTAMMHDQLEHIVFNPYWYPPRSIAVREILPKVKADPNYLDRQNFDVLEDQKPIDASQINWDELTSANFKYRFRQRPGRTNSLGEVKFMFPNRYSIYMHDTNAKSLFDNPIRALSHGCVRLENPAALAAAVLDWDRGWQSKNVSQAMAGSKQKYVKLKQTLPVYLVYFTASVENDTVRFHQDIYGHDARHIAANDKAAPTLVAKLLEKYRNRPRLLDNEPANKPPETNTVATQAVATTVGAG